MHMKIFNSIIGVGFTLLLLSCGSKSALTDTDYVGMLDRMSVRLDSLNRYMIFQSDVLTQKDRNIKVNTTVTRYSEPDSTGNQHKVEETVTNMETAEKETRNEQESYRSQLQYLSNRIDSLSDSSRFSQVSDIKEDNPSLWDRIHQVVYISVITALVILLLIIFFRRK